MEESPALTRAEQHDHGQEGKREMLHISANAMIRSVERHRLSGHLCGSANNLACVHDELVHRLRFPVRLSDRSVRRENP